MPDTLPKTSWYTYRQAAKRVGRATTAIKRWRRNGMPMSWDSQGRRIVEHDTLLEWWRGTLERDNRNKRHQQDTPITARDLLDLR